MYVLLHVTVKIHVRTLRLSIVEDFGCTCSFCLHEELKIDSEAFTLRLAQHVFLEDPLLIVTILHS